MDVQSRQLLKIGIVANVFEWYEFSIVGFLASLIAPSFFQASHPIIELLHMYAIFALSFIARPLGGIVFGIIGDRMSRSTALRLSLLLMSIPTVLIGLLPTYDQIGNLAAISLLVLRLLQGFAAGGELPMTACYVFEASPAYNRSLLCSVIAISPKLGMLLASLVSFLLVRLFDAQALSAWAWRIPFLLGVPLTLFIMYLRQKIQEPEKMTKSPHTLQSSSSWRELMVPIVKAMSLVSFGAIYFYVSFLLMPTYLTHFLDVPQSTAYFTTTFTLCTILPLYLCVHYLANYFGYRKLLLASLSLMLILVIPVFKGVHTYYHAWGTLFLLQLILSVAYVGFDGILIETLGELFPQTNRSLSFGIAWPLAAALAGGTAPWVCTHVMYQTGWLMFPAIYMICFGVIAWLVAWSLLHQAPVAVKVQND